MTKKEFAQARIRYPVDTEFSECEITLLFVPTVEIAKVLAKYRNSILLFNPRSFLSLSKNSVNKEIARTIREKATNEFSLYNNGITMLSDETRFSERTGKPYRGQLHVKNPQIINGGQTAYTLSDIFEAWQQEGGEEDVFAGKEVMLKVITLVDPQIERSQRLRLIEAVSKATNQQTTVVEADRRSNDKVQLDLQQDIFEEFGYFYERKKGEFYDGLQNRYINRRDLLDREVALRVAYAISGRPEVARRTSAKILFGKEPFNLVMNDRTDSRKLFFGYRCYRQLDTVRLGYRGDSGNRYGEVNVGSALRYGRFAVISVATATLKDEVTRTTVDALAERQVDAVLQRWLDFEDYARAAPTNRRYFRKQIDPRSGEEVLELDFNSYYKVQNVRRDLEKYFEVSFPKRLRPEAD